MTVQHRQAIITAMIEVFRCDGHMDVLEADYFNSIADALNLTAVELLRL